MMKRVVCTVRALSSVGRVSQPALTTVRQPRRCCRSAARSEGEEEEEQSAHSDLTRMGLDNYIEMDWCDWSSNKRALMKAIPFFARESIESSRKSLQYFDSLANVSDMVSSPSLSVDSSSSSSANRIFDEIYEPHLSRLSLYLFESGGKLNRGTALINASMHLHSHLQGSKQAHPSAIGIRDTLALASAVELMQDCFLIVDDIMDEGRFRRGRPCYHLTLPESQRLSAINDGFIMEQIPYWISDRYLRGGSSMFLRQIFSLTTLGQLLDSTGDCCDTFEQCRKELTSLDDHSHHSSKPVISDCLSRLRNKYSLDRYLTLVALKTAHYTVRLPLLSALHLNGLSVVIREEEDHSDDDASNMDEVRKVTEFVTALSLRLGIQFQMDDDWLDLFSESIDQSGKQIGGDMVAMKCSFINCLMFQLCNEDDLTRVIIPHFGKSDSSESIAILKKLCVDIGVLREYENHKARNFALIERMVAQIGDDPLLKRYLTEDMFSVFVSKLKDRKK